MARIGMGDGVPIEHNMISRAIERAQKQVEGQNFTVRKHLLEYDDVMNKQRETIYTQRKEILQGKDLREYFINLIDTLIEWMLDTYANKEKAPDDWDREALAKAVLAQFGLDINTLGIDWSAIVFDDLQEKVVAALRNLYGQKETTLGPFMREFERMILLQVIDSQWKDHLLEMDHLKEGIGLRGYGQRDPLIEYKKESFEMFQSMLDRIEEDAVRYVFLIQPVVEQPVPVRRQAPVFYQQPQGPTSQRAKQARSMIPGKRKKR
jgi:preprotein translocase subunit SecA